MGALETIEVNCPLVHLNTNKEASTYLKTRENLQPWLILLGLNGQYSETFNFLEAIKTDNNLRLIPVVIIAASNEEHKVAKSYNLGAAGYIVKPCDISGMAKTIRTIMQYWSVQILPTEGTGFCQ